MPKLISKSYGKPLMEFFDWIREHCRVNSDNSQADPDYWLEPVKNLMMTALLGIGRDLWFVSNERVGDKYFPHFPEKVCDKIVSYLTHPKDLLNLRLVSKLTKEWVDCYPQLESALNPFPVTFQDMSDVARFLSDNKGLPFTFFIFNLEMESFFYEAPPISSFLWRFGSKVNRIVLPCLYQMEHESEFEFYESLPNLKELYLSCTLPLFAAAGGNAELIKFPLSMPLIEKFEKCCGMIPPDKKKPARFPSFCENLRVLQIHHSIRNDYPFQMISKCVNLENLKIPRYSNPEIDLSSSADEKGVNYLVVNKCSYLCDLLKSNHRMKRIDLQDLLFLDEVTESDDFENKEYLFYDMVRDRDIILENVSILVMTYLDGRYGRSLVEDLAVNIASIKGFGRIICEVDFPNLRSIKIYNSCAFIEEADFRKLGNFPKLESISVETDPNWMLSPRGGGRRKAERFFTALLKIAATSTKDRVRVDVAMGLSIYSAMVVPGHQTLFINLIMSTFYETPYNLSRLVVTPFEHLERLIVVFNPMNQKIFEKFVKVMSEKFAGTLRSLDFETNGHVDDKWLRPMVGLKRLFVLKFKLGKDTCVISEKLFSEVLRNLALEALELEGIGFWQVTPVALRWLTTREFSNTIKHFYFDNRKRPGTRLDPRISKAVAGVRTLCEINQIMSGGAPALTEFLTALKEPAEFTNSRCPKHGHSKR